MRRGGAGGFGGVGGFRGDGYVSSRLFARPLDSSSSWSFARLRLFLARSKDSELFPLKGECLGSSCLRSTVASRSLSVSPVGSGVRVLPRLEDWSFDLCEWWRLRLCCDVAMFCASPTDPFGCGCPTTVGDLCRRRRSRERERFSGCEAPDGIMTESVSVKTTQPSLRDHGEFY